MVFVLSALTPLGVYHVARRDKVVDTLLLDDKTQAAAFETEELFREYFPDAPKDWKISENSKHYEYMDWTTENGTSEKAN